MRLTIDLEARRQTAYMNAAHNKLRGLLWQALGDGYDEIRNSPRPMPLSFSCVWPWDDPLTPNRTYHVTVASPDEAILHDLADSLRSYQEFNVGEMPLRIVDLHLDNPDVGPAETEGVLETVTGLLCSFSHDVADEYGLDTSPIEGQGPDAELYWRQSHGVGPLREAIRRSLQRRHEYVYPDLPGPMDVDEPLFTWLDPIKDKVTYPLPFTPTTGTTYTVILSKWRFGYRVRNSGGSRNTNHHRRHLNLALNTGVGRKTAHGFGFLSIDYESRTNPRADYGITTETESESIS